MGLLCNIILTVIMGSSKVFADSGMLQTDQITKANGRRHYWGKWYGILLM